jgi:hypothetical protein
MATFYPVCVTIAFFTALLIFDVLEREVERINSHIFLALISTFLMVYLSFKDMELVSWGLLLIPVVVFVTCYFLGYAKPTKIASVPYPAVPSTTCQPAPTISNPEASITAHKIISDNQLCNV